MGDSKVTVNAVSEMLGPPVHTCNIALLYHAIIGIFSPVAISARTTLLTCQKELAVILCSELGNFERVLCLCSRGRFGSHWYLERRRGKEGEMMASGSCAAVFILGLDYIKQSLTHGRAASDAVGGSGTSKARDARRHTTCTNCPRNVAQPVSIRNIFRFDYIPWYRPVYEVLYVESRRLCLGMAAWKSLETIWKTRRCLRTP